MAESLRVRKRFGQHFLHDPAVIDRILRAIAPQSGETLVEIGPGRGVLTRVLAERAGRLYAIEIDRDLVAELKRLFSTAQHVHVVAADALRVDFQGFGEKIRVFGNLPYNISTPLLFHLIDYTGHIVDAHFMLQREVVERMAAAPGSKTYGRLSVMVQSYWRVTKLFDVGPGAFSPRPKVKSAVIRLEPRGIGLSAGGRVAFDKIVAAAFSQRRKTLRNALIRLLSEASIRAAGIDPGARAETLSIQQFVELSRQTSYKSDDSRQRDT